MKKLHSVIFYALVTPAITLGAGLALAQDTTKTKQTDQSTQRTNKYDSKMEGERKNLQAKAGMHSRGYLNAVPANGMQASNLIGTEVKTANDEDIGEVVDLIIDGNGKVLAIVVSVGGFLGMGEKDVAVAWSNVTRTGDADEQELRVDVTREDLNTAPKFERRD